MDMIVMDPFGEPSGVTPPRMSFGCRRMISLMSIAFRIQSRYHQSYSRSHRHLRTDVIDEVARLGSTLIGFVPNREKV
jgi:hypothetical protein